LRVWARATAYEPGLAKTLNNLNTVMTDLSVVEIRKTYGHITNSTDIVVAVGLWKLTGLDEPKSLPNVALRCLQSRGQLSAGR
jgi:hypothetical protein